MFERARHFLKRLSDTDADTISMEDRRLHPRFKTDIRTVCRLAIDNSALLDCKIRDISRGGINLVLDQPLEEGSMICVDLPLGAQSLPVTVLACVMHSKQLSDMEFSHGCTFSAELSDHDLNRFGAEKVPSPKEDERSYQRFEAHGHVDFERVPVDRGEPGEGKIVNISPAGVGLLLNQPIEPGNALRLHLKRSESLEPVTVLACVVYLGEPTPQGWFVGCNFIHELTQHDIDSLV